MASEEAIFQILEDLGAPLPTWQRKQALPPAAVASERQRNLSEEHLPVCAIRGQQLTVTFGREKPTAGLGAPFWEGAGVEIPKSFGTKPAPGSSSQAKRHHAGFESASGAPENNKR